MDALTTALRGAVAGLVIGLALGLVVVLVATFVGFWALAPIGGGLGEAAGLGRDGVSVVAFVAAVLGAVGAGLPTWWATAGSGRPSPGPPPSPLGPGGP